MFVETKREGEATPDFGTLRVDRILMLADEIEKPTRGFGFNMDWWSVNGAVLKGWPLREPTNYCGTVCCIGGHAEAMYGTKRDLGWTEAGRLLGLDEVKAYLLFYPNLGDYASISRSHAARVLRHLAATGLVDWSK